MQLLRGVSRAVDGLRLLLMPGGSQEWEPRMAASSALESVSVRRRSEGQSSDSSCFTAVISAGFCSW